MRAPSTGSSTLISSFAFWNADGTKIWQDLYQAYGRECGDRAAAYSHAKTAFDTLGLPSPDEAQPPHVTQGDEPGERRTKLKRGLRTPETAFYAPILDRGA